MTPEAWLMVSSLPSGTDTAMRSRPDTTSAGVDGLGFALLRARRGEVGRSSRRRGCANRGADPRPSDRPTRRRPRGPVLRVGGPPRGRTGWLCAGPPGPTRRLRSTSLIEDAETALSKVFDRILGLAPSAPVRSGDEAASASAVH